ncbi:hypothetical protein [Halomonas sp. E14]|uniref:hypothetical protein n=1 Tax=Halomonas sp. E14 TaxID=3397245 RepID=UPI00403E4A2F
MSTSTMMAAPADDQAVELALEDEIRQILAEADDSLSVAEIFARSALAEGRHSLAARLASMAKRGLLVTHPCSTGRCYSLPKLAHAAPPKTTKGQVHAHLVKMGRALSLRQIADNLRLERRAVTRALNALGRDGLVEKLPLDGHGRMAWQALGARPAAEASPLGALIARLGSFAPAKENAEGDEKPAPVFALASDGSLTLCAHEVELLLDADEAEALLEYLAPFIQHRQARRAGEAA